MRIFDYLNDDEKARAVAAMLHHLVEGHEDWPAELLVQIGDYVSGIPKGTTHQMLTDEVRRLVENYFRAQAETMAKAAYYPWVGDVVIVLDSKEHWPSAWPVVTHESTMTAERALRSKAVQAITKRETGE